MQFIYEGLLGDYPGASNSRYAPDPRNSGLHTYPNPLDFNKGNTGSSVSSAFSPAGLIEAEEDIDRGIISTLLVINKLNEFKKEAKRHGMDWAEHSFITLEKFILKNNQNPT